MLGSNLAEGSNAHGTWGGTDRNGNNAVIGRSHSLFGRILVDAQRETAVGVFDGRVRLTQSAGQFGSGAAALDSSNLHMDGNLWWRPNDMFRLGIGHDLRNGTGAGAMDWFWNAATDHSDVHMWASILHGFGFNSRMPFIGDGYNPAGGGLALAVTPMGDMLHVHVGLPYHFVSGSDAHPIGEIFRRVYARAYANIDGVGRIGFGYQNPNGQIADGNNVTTNLGLLYAFYQNTMVPNTTLRFGVSYMLPATRTIEVAGAANQTSDVNSRIAIGAQASHRTGDFGFMGGAALGMWMGGEQAVFGGESRASHRVDATSLTLDLAPFYQVTSDVRVTFNSGFGIDFPGSEFRAPASGDNTVDPRFWYVVNPYVTLNFASASHFLGGFQLLGNNGAIQADGSRSNGGINWAIPIGIVFVW
jgi:hypothetical protein